MFVVESMKYFEKLVIFPYNEPESKVKRYILTINIIIHLATIEATLKKIDELASEYNDIWERVDSILLLYFML